MRIQLKICMTQYSKEFNTVIQRHQRTTNKQRMKLQDHQLFQKYFLGFIKVQYPVVNYTSKLPNKLK